MTGSQASWPRRRSVFWRVAAVLVGAELVVGILAIGLGARFAYDRGVELAETSIRLRLDALAEEVERGVSWQQGGLHVLPEPLLRDLAARFPDPVSLVDAGGRLITTVRPGDEPEEGAAPFIPDQAARLLDEGAVVVRGATRAGPGFALAPVYDDAGFLAGGLVVSPIDASMERELAPVRVAFIRATLAVGLVALVIALLLGGAFTWWMVRPIRRIADRVEEIGRGEYDARLPRGGADEIDRLAGSVNRMAAEVASSFDRLRATDRIRRELVANVGHDLRTPLAAVLARLEEAERHLLSGERSVAAEHLVAARSQGDYLHRLVDDLFELSLLESPTPPLRREPVLIAELVDDVIRRHARTCAKRGVSLQVEHAAGLPTVHADGNRLLRVLDNLLANACRYAKEGGRVLLASGYDDDRISIRVRDDGPGLDPGDSERVFDRYYRGKDARTRDERGSGLGLAIALAIARAHGGTLAAENHPDGGALFTLMLPQVPNEKGPAD